MSSELVDDNAMEWRTFTSKNGVAFQVGVNKATEGVENKGEGEKMEPPESKVPFDIAVNWPVGDDSWKPTPQEIITVAAITRYRLFRSTSPIWDYHLEVTVTEHYDYIFIDGTGDIYPISVWADGDHSVLFNSSNAAITHIKGD